MQRIHSITYRVLGLCCLMVFVLSPAQTAQAQSQCVFYFPVKKGAEFEHTYYNKKGKVDIVSKHTVLDQKTVGSKVVINARNEQFDAKNKPFAQADYEVFCEGNVFKYKFGQVAMQGMGQNGQNMDMAIEGDFLTLPANPQAGQSLDDAHISMKMNSGGMGMNMKVHIQNRKVEAVEQVTVPAGTFECIKVSYQSEMKMMMTIRTRTIEWFAKDIGLVKAEYYDKSGKKSGSTELTALKR